MIYSECEKALSCLSLIENMLSTSAHHTISDRSPYIPQDTLLYVKFTILIRMRDTSSAAQTLHALIMKSNIYDTALNAILLYVETCNNVGKVSEFYQGDEITSFFLLLGQRFPSDPEFTRSRIAHVQSILLCVKPSGILHIFKLFYYLLTNYKCR